MGMLEKVGECLNRTLEIWVGKGCPEELIVWEDYSR